VCYSGDNQVFGGIPIVLGGDFAQILPVIRHGSRQATLLACIHHSAIWANLQVLQLSTSMGVMVNDANIVFLTFLKNMVTNTPNHMGILNCWSIFVVFPTLINCVISYIISHY